MSVISTIRAARMGWEGLTAAIATVVLVVCALWILFTRAPVESSAPGGRYVIAGVSLCMALVIGKMSSMAFQEAKRRL